MQLVANPALSDIWLLHLEEVAELEIRDNPFLSKSTFAAVQDRRQSELRNLDSPASPTAP